MNIYDFQARTIDGNEQSMGNYRDQVLLIVNVASQCGFTPQYTGLEALYRKLHPRGFSVLGFPCDQFGQQEPGNEQEIKSFCTTKYDVTFPMFAKIVVKGDSPTMREGERTACCTPVSTAAEDGLVPLGAKRACC